MSGSVLAKLRYQGVVYEAVDNHWFLTKPTDEDIEFVHDSWLDGNFSCDCNCSVFIQGNFPEFPFLGCGEEIELLSLMVTWPELDCFRLLYQKPLSIEDRRDWKFEGVIIVPAHEMPRWEG